MNMQQIFYDSRGGNTRKLAEAMAAELGLKVVDVKAASIDLGNGVLFLGSGCYGGKPGKNMETFITTHDFRGRKIALFGTSGGGTGQEVQVMAGALKGKGANVIGSYHCQGQTFMLISRGHPNAADIAAARNFAREMSSLP